MTAPLRYGSEFRANTTTSGNEDSASVTALAGGKFVVVWEDDATGTNDVRRQIYNADGTKFGGEVIVAVGSEQPDVVGTPDGRFAMAWGTATGGAGIHGQVFNPDGTSPAGTYSGPFVVDEYSNTVTSLAIAAAQGGRFMVGFSYEVGDSDPFERAYNAAGPFASTRVSIPATAAQQTEMAVTSLSNGNYMMVWADSGTSGQPDADGDNIRYELVDGTGGPLYGGLAEFSFGGKHDQPSIAGLSDGRAILVYRLTADDGSTAINAVPIQADGSHVDESSFSGPGGAALSQPTVAATPNGYVLAYVEAGGLDGSGTGIRVACYNNDGSLAFSEGIFAESTVTAGDQLDPDIAVLADGRFVVTWTDPGFDAAQSDSSGNSVRAQIFDPRVAAVNLVGKAFADDLVGTGFGDSIIGAAGNDSLNGAAGNDTLGGGDDGDTLKGGLGVDKLYGNDGNDRLDGGPGGDSLTGGAGDDIFIVDSTADQVVEATASGTDTVFASVSFVLSSGQSVDVLATASQGGTMALNLTGNESAQAIRGNDGANRLTGGGGADSLYGFGGNDTFYVDNAAEKVSEAVGQGSDTVFASLSYALSTGQSIDLLATTARTGATAITLTGNDQAQRIDGNYGVNGLYGGDGNDTLYGFDGNDRLGGGNGRDQMDGGIGTDIFSYSAVAQSTGVNRDLIQNINFAQDRIDLQVAVTGIDAKVVGGTLNEAAFDTNIATVIGSGQLAAHHAVLFDPSAGTADHGTDLYLVIDVNGTAGYQAGVDYVIELANAAGTLTLGDFT